MQDLSGCLTGKKRVCLYGDFAGPSQLTSFSLYDPHQARVCTKMHFIFRVTYMIVLVVPGIEAICCPIERTQALGRKSQHTYRPQCGKMKDLVQMYVLCKQPGELVTAIVGISSVRLPCTSLISACQFSGSQMIELAIPAEE
jgi:hypothetical protein